MNYKEAYQINQDIEKLSRLRQVSVNDTYRALQYNSRYKHLVKHNPEFVAKVNKLIFELGSITHKVKNQTKLDTFKERTYRLLSI